MHMMGGTAGLAIESVDRGVWRVTPHVALHTASEPFDFSNPLACEFLLTACVGETERVGACKAEATPTQRDFRAARVRSEQAFRVVSTQAVRLPIVPGDTLRLRLRASWTDARGQRRTHEVLDGCFVVPEKYDMYGAAGYCVGVPTLDTLAYVYVSSVLLADSTVRQEMIGFDIVLFY